jgi:F-type H+-transporting ATPase subunit a
VRELLHPRILAILAVVVGACFLNTILVPHHDVENPFIKLYMHLQPEGLVLPSEHAHEPAHADAGAAHEGEATADAAHGDAAHGHYLFAPTLPLPAIFDGDAHHEGTQLVLTNLQIFQIASVLLIFICFTGVPSYLRTGRGGDVVTRLFAGFALWVRDEVVQPVMGREMASRWAPYFLTVFFFILFMNLGGLLPHSATPTASIFVTGAMALTTFVCMLAFGMAVQGPVAFWKHLVPHVPIFIWPLMFVVEVVGLIIKPVALMLRLFATMSGGHMVVLSFMGLAFFFAANFSGTTGYAVGFGLSVPFGVFVMIIESFVALLQAFIFTQLSVIFVNMAIHPEH